MKRMFLSLVALVVATMSYAQNTLVATLTHEGNMSVYYGENAFVQAHAAAENGDLITLSSGVFKCESITKAVTIKGAGMETDAEKGIVRTELIGSQFFKISSPSDTEHILDVEGVFFGGTSYVPYDCTLINANFTKCGFCGSETYKWQLRDVTFTQCMITKFNHYRGNPLFINCYVAISQWDSAASATFINCYVSYPVGVGYTTAGYGSHYLQNTYSPQNSVFQNCILGATFGFPLPTTNVANNCICFYHRSDYGGTQSLFNGLNSSANNVSLGKHENASGVFLREVNPNQYYPVMFANDLILTDEIRGNYLGDDGTEVGVYGGMYPYDPVPSAPRITKCEVAKRPTADGKLSVNIEVTTPEQ